MHSGSKYAIGTVFRGLSDGGVSFSSFYTHIKLAAVVNMCKCSITLLADRYSSLLKTPNKSNRSIGYAVKLKCVIYVCYAKTNINLCVGSGMSRCFVAS